MARDSERCLGVRPVSTSIRLAVVAAAGFIRSLMGTHSEQWAWVVTVSFTNSPAQRPAPPPQSGLRLAGWPEGFFPLQEWDRRSVAMSY